jgi:hypothetical protein
MEDDSMILPPDDNEGRPFYQDPPDRPGMHRDMFKAWAHTILGELHSAEYKFSQMALNHLPPEYLSCDSCSEEEEDARSDSSLEEDVREEEAREEVDSSDEEGAHLPMATRREKVDSSDEEGALKSLPAGGGADSSDVEGAHLDGGGAGSSHPWPSS